MALIGHISGSTQSNSAIGISGSVIIANRPAATFPASPGTDVVFFVSGSRDNTSRTMFGGDVVGSGSLTLKNLTGVTQFSASIDGVSILDSSGTSKFSIASSTGNATIAGSLSVTGASTFTGSPTFQAATFNGNITGKGTNNQIDSLSLTGSTGLAVTGPSQFTGAVTAQALTLNGNLTAKGTSNNIDSLSVTGSTGLGVTRSLIVQQSITGSSTLTVSGQSLLNGGVSTTTMAASSNATVGGTLSVTGNVTAAGTGNQFNALSVTGSSGLSVTSNATVSGNMTVAGDLTVNGSTVTVNTTNLEVKDAVVGLGFASGTVGQSGNDRGLILGLGNGPHAAFLWKNTDSEFAVGSTTSSATGSLPITLSSYSNFHAANILGSIITASLGFSGSLTKLADGTSYIIGGSNITVTTGSNGSITIDGSASGAPAGAQYVTLATNGSLTDERVLTAGTGLRLVDGGAGSTVTLSINDSVVATVSGTAFQGTIEPRQSDLYNLGTPSGSWYKSYISQMSGSHTKLLDGTSAFIGGAGITIATGSNGAVTFSATGGGGDVFGPASATDGAVALFNTSTGKLLKNSFLTSNANTDALFIAGNLGVSGSISLGDATSDTVSFTARVNTNVLPSADMTYELGSSTFRWAHVYTGDLHLRNDRGDYTLIEEEEFLSIRFNKTGKRYKFVLEAVPELDEDPIVR